MCPWRLLLLSTNAQRSLGAPRFTCANEIPNQLFCERVRAADARGIPTWALSIRRTSRPGPLQGSRRKVDRQFQLGFRHKGGNVLAAERTAHFEVANRSRRLPHTLDMQRATRRPGPVYCQVGHK